MTRVRSNDAAVRAFTAAVMRNSATSRDEFAMAVESVAYEIEGGASESLYRPVAAAITADERTQKISANSSSVNDERFSPTAALNEQDE